MVNGVGVCPIGFTRVVYGFDGISIITWWARPPLSISKKKSSSVCPVVPGAILRGFSCTGVKTLNPGNPVFYYLAGIAGNVPRYVQIRSL